MSFLKELKRIINEEIAASQENTAFKISQLMSNGQVNGMGTVTAIDQTLEGVKISVKMNDGTVVTAVPGAGQIVVGMAVTVVGGAVFG